MTLILFSVGVQGQYVICSGIADPALVILQVVIVSS